MVEHLDELVDLLELARQRRYQLALGRGHTQRRQKGRAERDRARLLAVVRERRRRRMGSGRAVQAGLAAFGEAQFALAVGGQNVQVLVATLRGGVASATFAPGRRP